MVRSFEVMKEDIVCKVQRGFQESLLIARLLVARCLPVSQSRFVRAGLGDQQVVALLELQRE